MQLMRQQSVLPVLSTCKASSRAQQKVLEPWSATKTGGPESCILCRICSVKVILDFTAEFKNVHLLSGNGTPDRPKAKGSSVGTMHCSRLDALNGCTYHGCCCCSCTSRPEKRIS